ncbi:hypothetical protein ACLB2K_047087 [Fragaria x ananassa]
MVGSQLTQDAGSVPSMEQVFQMLTKLEADQDKKIKLPNEDFNGHVLSEKIKLPSNQSSGEDFSLDGPTSKEGTTLSINDKEHEVESGEILDNNLVSKTDVLPQEDKLEGRTELSTLEEEIGSHTDGEA